MSDTRIQIYIVDDDLSAREGVARLIRSAGLIAKTFVSAEEFLAAAQSKAPDCLILDVNLPGLNGLDLQQELAKRDVETPIIFLTGHGDIPMTVRAVKAGAVNFLTKPFDDEELLKTIRQCIESHSERANPEFESEDIVGNSSAIKKVFQQVSIVAPTDSTVLLHGETGTGKELIARAIHNRSARRDCAFVRMNCAAIPSGLLESELFGHERGAFTGAIMQKIGRLELADHGSLFLDEIGDISLELQPKLLRVLQEREFERLGSTRTKKVDVRVVAATHRDLEGMILDHQFRSDLFYRLNVVPIFLPPLRERPEDIPLLARHFVRRFARRTGKRIDTIPPSTMDALRRYSWPGNIRELENVIERAAILSSGPVLRVSCQDLRTRVALDDNAEHVQTLEDVERNHILKTLKETQWTLSGPSGAAGRLGLNRSTLYFRMKKLGIARSVEASFDQ
jgi:DNA-binding NtrC family response regulator